MAGIHSGFASECPDQERYDIILPPAWTLLSKVIKDMGMGNGLTTCVNGGVGGWISWELGWMGGGGTPLYCDAV